MHTLHHTLVSDAACNRPSYNAYVDIWTYRHLTQGACTIYQRCNISYVSVKRRNPFQLNFITYSSPEYQPIQPKQNTIPPLSPLEGNELRIHPYTPILEIITLHGNTPEQSLPPILPRDIHDIAIILLFDFILTFCIWLLRFYKFFFP